MLPAKCRGPGIIRGNGGVVRYSLVLMLALGAAAPAFAEQVTVAVASNFAKPAEQLAEMYRKQDAGADIRFSAGSSGKLYAQIEHGAPFDILLSADAERPEQLEAMGLTVPG